MNGYEKALYILTVIARIRLSREVVLLQPEDIIKKCKSSEELDFYYRKLCVKR